ncbi:TetR/AcrR family transcriptional regulator C-terminal domain-containing protein [Nocardia thailandica]|uniref:TetR/AcrR family transcriptional regulator C-terminal domain-containing protein n=1 Tax=Nocardia thailandica TaxID=257275 RepID=UPI00031F1C96|nr:TetR/AcrR family transcriptional regulator C-terminal domain-containing protein [Nocardia thailandica]
MPRDTLTREHIVRTAVALLDEEGLDGLNMRELGKRLDAAATAMYWHVGNKDTLIRLACDRVWGEIPLPDPESGNWRDAAETLATGMYTMIARHPWLLQAQAGYLLYGPNKARHDDCVLAVYEHAGFDEDTADKAAATVFTFVLGTAAGASATIALKRRLSRTGTPAPETRLTAALTEATAIARTHPRLRARIERATASAGFTRHPDTGFTFGLAALLDGLSARVPNRGGAEQPLTCAEISTHVQPTGAHGAE